MNTSYNQPGTNTKTHRNAADEINPIRALVHRSGLGLLTLALAHPFLAMAMQDSPRVSTMHALLTILIGLSSALLSKDVRKVSFVAAYIAGAELLWRMTQAQIFWEAGKYSIVLMLGIALLRIKSWKRASLPVIYFCLLCISIPLTISALGISDAAQEAVSFNLSGPLVLAVASIYFSQVTFDQSSMRRLMGWVIIPILGVATLTIYSTLSAEQIVFTDESNFTTSGGFGPNQVSAILGLGGGLFLLAFLMGKGAVQRFIFLISAIGLLVLSALTFSRGGIYNAAIMGALALAHYVGKKRDRLAVITLLVITGMVGGYLIFPRLNAFTGGMLQQRFSSLDTTLRGQIAKADLTLWMANPVLGVGPGLSKISRSTLLGSEIATHTEYTRVLAEHGMAGLLALLIMLVMSIRAYLRAPDLQAQAWVAALLAWPLMEMSHAAMRIAAISFLFGLAMVNWAAAESAAQLVDYGRKNP